MRIIGGKYRGKKLLSPESSGVRPTTDRAKEAVFNILTSRINWSGSTVADVFCGSGAMGLEALSRGAEKICLIDMDMRAAKKNVALFPLEKNNITLLKADALKLPRAEKTFDVVFLDAPYNKGLSTPALLSLAQQNWLHKGSLCLVEVEKEESVDIPSVYTLLDERIYGLAKFLLLTFQG